MCNKFYVMNKIFFVSIIFTALFAVSCKKNKTPDAVVFPEENPFYSFVSIGKYNEIIIANNTTNNVETGYGFKPLVNGKINAIVVNIPIVTPICKYTIWKRALTPVILKTGLLNVTTALSEKAFAIEPVLLTKNETYFIAINSPKYFQRFIPSGIPKPMFPLTIGNIQITHIAFVTIAGAYPSSFGSGFILDGDISFNFQQTE